MSPDPLAAALNELHAWLAASLPTADGPAPDASLLPGGGVDLNTLLREFIALRQEVNLQTRAVRAQQERSDEALRQSQQAVELLRQARAEAARQQTASLEEALRPPLKALTDLYDALSLAARETQRARDTLEPLLDELTAEPPAADEPEPPLPELPPPEPAHAGNGREPLPPSLGRFPWWARWLGARPPDAAALDAWKAWYADQLERERQARRAAVERAEALRQAAQGRLEDLRTAASRQEAERAESRRRLAEQVRRILTGLLDGYAMSLQRVERALRQQGLEAIPAVGRAFDPERMEVLEAVADSGRPAGEVLEEVRRGYTWNGRVFRFAQVRVARGGGSPLQAPAGEL